MRKIFYLFLIFFILFGVEVSAAEVSSDDLKLTVEQNQKLSELKEKLRSEVQPIWEEIENSKKRITEIEKKYFEEFWNMLTDEQKQIFSKLN